MKIRKIFIIVIMAFVFTSCESGFDDMIGETNADVKVYNLGDTGPAGGTIFYVNSNYMEDGWRYLEAAPKSRELFIAWSYWTDYVSGTYTGIGKGYDNTTVVINKMQTLVSGTHPECAALDCKNLSYVYNTVTFNDWFLPSRDELSAMAVVCGDLTSPRYWSSSQYPVTINPGNAYAYT